MNKLFKLISVVLIFLTPIALQAGSIIVPIHHHSSGGSVTIKMMLGLYLAFNIFLVAFYFCRTIIWHVIHPDDTFYEYVIWSDMEYGFVDFATITFVIINGIALLSYVATLIANTL